MTLLLSVMRFGFVGLVAVVVFDDYRRRDIFVGKRRRCGGGAGRTFADLFFAILQLSERWHISPLPGSLARPVWLSPYRLPFLSSGRYALRWLAAASRR